tara:strand:- start:108 stop:458 length:351 start_codon:yes stop_codon:yes gene_type:complete
MDKKHVLYFSVIGIPIGLLELWGIHFIIINIFWIIFTLATAFYLITRQRINIFTEGFVIGFFSRGIATMTAPIYTYLINSSNTFEQYTNIVLIQSTIAGLLVGFISFALYRMNYFQ